MAKKVTRTQKLNELDGKEFFAAIALIEGKRNPPGIYDG